MEADIKRERLLVLIEVLELGVCVCVNHVFITL